MDGELETIIARYKLSKDKQFTSFAAVDITLLHESGVVKRWVEENNEEGDDLVSPDILAKLILKERLRLWIEKIYNDVIKE